MAELVYAFDLKSNEETRTGSSPVSATKSSFFMNYHNRPLIGVILWFVTHQRRNGPSTQNTCYSFGSCRGGRRNCRRANRKHSYYFALRTTNRIHRNCDR